MSADAATPTRSRLLIALPVLVSLFLSALTVGNKAHWQDSAIYLVAVKEFSVLYPPGFCLYLGLCKAWTLLLGFVDFTLAVHLFSSLCAALAAGVLARAAEQVTKDRLASAVIGCLAAAGYTWWFSGLYAKGYALYFLVVALLLWRMACRDHARVILLTGLAWAAHPSAVLLGPAVLLYLARHRREVRALGLRRGILAVLASVLAAVGPSLLLPVLAARESITSMGNPSSVGAWFQYLLGSRFTSIPGVWGFVGWRWTGIGRLAWEEFLGIGALLAVLGIRALIQERREERWMLLVWILPVVAGAALFKIEGQYDFWMVAAWMPVWICAALGLSLIRKQLPQATAIALAGGLAWAAAANGKDLYLRGDDRPETLGRCALKTMDPGALFIAGSDDLVGMCRYLQVVRGYRTDVRIVQISLVAPVPEARWYTERLEKKWPGFETPDFNLVMLHASRFNNTALTQGAIIQSQKPGAPPVFFTSEPAAPLVSSGSIVPAGFLWKWTGAADARPEPRYWDYPITLEEAATVRGRIRGISVTFGTGTVEVRPEPYEDRLVYYLAEARRMLGDMAQREGTRQGFERSAQAYESILKSASMFADAPEVLYPLALDYYMLDRLNDAASLFQRVSELAPGPLKLAGSHFYLGELHRAAGRQEMALEHYRKALEAVPADSPLRGELQKRLGK